MIRLIPEEKFYSDYYLPKARRIVRSTLLRCGRGYLFDDICAEVHLKMIPVLRSTDPTATGWQNYGTWLYFTILDMVYDTIKVLRTKPKFKIRIDDCASLDALDEKYDYDFMANMVPDPQSLAPFEYFEEDDNRVYFWKKLLPVMVGDERARVLYCLFVEEMSRAEVAKALGRTESWVGGTRETSIEIIRYMADSDEQIKAELYDCLR